MRLQFVPLLASVCRSVLCAVAVAVVLSGLGAAPSAAAPGVKAFARCEPYTGKDDAVDDIAVDYFVEEFGGTRKSARRWLRAQAVAEQIPEVMRDSPARRDFMNMSFDNRRKKVNIYVRHHGHDRAIRRCARQMRIERYLHIGLRKWSSGDLLRAIRKVTAALPELYEAGGFDCGYGADDYFTCEVYRTVTDEQLAQIEAAAKATGVGYRLERVDADPPVGEALALVTVSRASGGYPK